MWCPSCMYFYDEVQNSLAVPRAPHDGVPGDRLSSLEFTHRVDAPVALHYHSQSEPRRREGAAARRLLEPCRGSATSRSSRSRGSGALHRRCPGPARPVRLGWLIRDAIGRRAPAGRDLATVYHGCQRLICGFEAEGSIAIEHYLSVFARALGIEFEDRYKTFRLCRTRNACWPSRRRADANHVEPTRAGARERRSDGCDRAERGSGRFLAAAPARRSEPSWRSGSSPSSSGARAPTRPRRSTSRCPGGRRRGPRLRRVWLAELHFQKERSFFPHRSCRAAIAGGRSA